MYLFEDSQHQDYLRKAQEASRKLLRYQDYLDEALPCCDHLRKPCCVGIIFVSLMEASPGHKPQGKPCHHRWVES